MDQEAGTAEMKWKQAIRRGRARGLRGMKAAGRLGKTGGVTRPCKAGDDPGLENVFK